MTENGKVSLTNEWVRKVEKAVDGRLGWVLVVFFLCNESTLSFVSKKKKRKNSRRF
jgi:hypothetical protein